MGDKKMGDKIKRGKMRGAGEESEWMASMSHISGLSLSIGRTVLPNAANSFPPLCAGRRNSGYAGKL